MPASYPHPRQTEILRGNEIMTSIIRRPHAVRFASIFALSVALAGQAARAAEVPPASTDNGIAEGSDIMVTATKANQIAPVTASLKEAQPASIVSRSFIEDSLPASVDFNEIALISPSVSNTGSTNGVGLNESKTQIRGFQDGEYNITYDGVPFGDTNDPSHHSNTFFPSNTIETLVVDRGPGNASQLGIATFGGNMNMFSRETRADPSLELKGNYGTFNTYMFRGVAQTGAIDRLGGTEGVFSAQYIKTDGALTYSGYNQKNIFGKIAIPIGSSVKLSLLSTYNKNHFNQPDSDGSTLQQVALYGKDYSLNNDPTSESYYKYNKTTKTTDFEIVKLEANIAPNSVFTNSAYTYYYDNETLSGNSATNLQGVADTVTLADGKTKAPGVAGYTKTNRYRVWGDIAKLRFDFGFGALTTGLWLEHNDTYRQQTDVNLVTGGFNYIEKKVTNPVTGAATPQYVKFDQNSNGDQAEEFAELELRPIEGLTITPGFKHVSFTRKLDALYNQKTRYAQALTQTNSKNLPYAQINYAIKPNLSVYGEFAKGFLVPGLSTLYIARPDLSTVKPQTSTNYQAGVVYHGSRLSLDFDGYYIDFNNKIGTTTVLDSTNTLQTVYYNQGGVIYKGLEGQATYVVGHGLAVFGNGSLNYAKERHTRIQIANAPKATAAGGIIYKAGPIRLSLIDKWTGPQYAIKENANADGTNSIARQVRIDPYNTTILAASYEWRNLRLGLTVTDLFNSTKITNLGLSGNGPTISTLNQTADQVYFQPGRQIMGDVTVRF
jgi:iron complex outermembrane recepter protein